MFEDRDVRVVAGPLFAEHRRGLFEHKDVLKMRLRWGGLFLFAYFLFFEKKRK